MFHYTWRNLSEISNVDGNLRVKRTILPHIAFPIGLSALITIVIFKLDVIFDAADFDGCVRVLFEEKSAKFDYIFIPVTCLMFCGTVLYSLTKLRRQRLTDTMINENIDQLEQHKKWFVIKILKAY
jgi:hypothetical protein